MNKPTLVIWGCKDTALNKDLAALPAKYVPNLTVKYIEDASHWVFPNILNSTTILLTKGNFVISVYSYVIS
jgi:hypothetical protein